VRKEKGMASRSRVRARVFNLVVALIATVLPGASIEPVHAQPKQVGIGIVGTTFLDISYHSLLLPGPLGYWEKEGYKVDVFPINGLPDAVQLLGSGKASFGSLSIIQANAQFSVPLQALVTNFTLGGWGIAVKKDGPIKSVKDLKGKKIGVSNFGSQGSYLLKLMLMNAGLEPEDGTPISTGVGAQALLALQGGQVDGLIYWASMLASFQNKDPNLQILRDPAIGKMPDFSLASTKGIIADQRQMVEAVTRGMVKAMVFADANPDCARRLMWKYYPDTKPTGVSDEKAISNDLNMITVLLDDHRENAVRMNPGGLFAGVNIEGMSGYQDFLLASGLVKRKVDPKDLVIPDGPAFWAKVNDFDIAAVIADAKACKY
jgi:NitT/TauT family transport system substrate-binding protein